MIRHLAERYPFDEAELEILVRCHDHINESSRDDFLMKLALASPYSYFFLPEEHPGDAMRDRVSWIENYVLPAGFANELRAAISIDAFVEYANQGEDKPLERFLEGVADTGRRGTKEALKVMYSLVDEPQPREIADFAVRLAVASDVLVAPMVNKETIMAKLEAYEISIDALAESMTEFCGGNPLSLQLFQDWAEEKLPMLSTPLSTFVHNLLFHGHAYPKGRISYRCPRLDQPSDIFIHPCTTPELVTLSFTSPKFGGKVRGVCHIFCCNFGRRMLKTKTFSRFFVILLQWKRLYSSFYDGRSFNRMEYSVLGYTGPTILLIRTSCDNVLGAFAEAPWKEHREFFGTNDCFLFQLKPAVKVLRAKGEGHNFMYLHSDYFQGALAVDGIPHGLGLGGTISKPRLFIPESFEHCTADYLDKTFEPGELLPPEALEKFEIKCLELWGVGGDEEIQKGLTGRAEFRNKTKEMLEKARTVHDRSAFAKDLKSGLLLGKLYDHQSYVRGRQDFAVDDKHGGYKIEH